jgi:hypothetical protein
LWSTVETAGSTSPQPSRSTAPRQQAPGPIGPSPRAR